MFLPRWTFLSITFNSFITRPLCPTKVVADHRLVISADTGGFDQLSTYIRKARHV